MLLTMQPLGSVIRDDGYPKPSLIKFYDFTKGGTDIADQLNDYHTYRSCIFRWDVVALLCMLYTIRVNSKTIWSLKNGLDVNKSKSFDFAWEHAMQLEKLFIRSRNISGLPRMTLDRMERILDEKVQVTPQTYGEKDERRRCKQCEKESSKNEKSKLFKTGGNCESCGMVVFRDHSIRLCNSYLEKL